MNVALRDTLLKNPSIPRLFELAERFKVEGVFLTVSQEQGESEEWIDSIQRGMRLTSVPVVSLTLDFPTVSLPSFQDRCGRILSYATQLNCPYVVLRMHGFFFESGESRKEEGIAMLNSLLRGAHEKGITLLLEGPFTKADLELLEGRLSAPNWGVCFDPAEALWYGVDPVYEIPKIGSKLEAVLCKDIIATAGDCRIGKGLLDFKALSNGMKEMTGLKWIVVEGPPTIPEIVGRDLGFVKSHFPAWKWDLRWPQFGAMSYEFPYKEGELDSLVELLQKYRIEFLQVGGTLLGEMVEHPDRIPAIRRRLEEGGIRAVGIAAYKNLITRDQEKYRKNMELMKHYLEIAPLMGTSVVATETGTLNPDHDFRAVPENWSEGAWKALYKTLDTLVPIAEQHGSCIALEGYVNNVIATLPHLQKVLKDFPQDSIQLVSDPCNFIFSRLLPVQENITHQFTELFEDRLVLAHIKDVNPAGAEKGTPEYGEGGFIIDGYLKFLRDQRPDLPLVLEHLPHEHMPIVIDRVKKKIAELEGSE